MFYWISSSVLVLLDFLLFWTTKTNIWPEMYYLPWLTGKGLMPYRDFFDDHGFLTHYVLAPFTFDSSLTALKIIFVLLQLASLITFILIIKKITTSKLLFLSGGVAYIAVSYFFSENNFWFEQFIIYFYLTTYLIIIQKNFKYQGVLAGLFIGLASLVKPQAGLIIAPIFLLKRKISSLTTFVAIWLAAFFFFAINNGLPALWDNLFVYNFYLSRYYRPTYFSDGKYILFSAVLIILAIVFIIKVKKKSEIYFLLIFLIISLSFLATGYARVRLSPAMTFFIILLITIISKINGWPKLLLSLTFGAYLFFAVGKTMQYYLLERDKKLYIEDKNNRLEWRLPKTYFRLSSYPLVEEYYKWRKSTR